MIVWAVIFILVGAFWWMGNMGWFVFRFARDWPLIIVAIGVYYVVRGFVRRRRGRRNRSEKLEILNELGKGKISVKEATKKLKK